EGAVEAMGGGVKQALKSSKRGQIAGLLARPALRAFKQKLDYAEIGGAPLLGVDGIALVCHGSSNGHALKNAIYAAARYSERGLTAKVAEALARTHNLFDEVDEDTKPKRKGLS